MPPSRNPPSTSNGERSPASLGRRAAGLSLDSKEKPRLRGTGLEFDSGETLEVSCLTRHPNPPTLHSVPAPNLPARNRTTAIILICKAALRNYLSGSGCPNLSSRVPGDSEGGNRPLVGRHDVREAVRPPRETPGRPLSLLWRFVRPLIFRVRRPSFSAVRAWQTHIVLAERRLAEHRTSPRPPSLAPSSSSRPRVRCALRKNLRPIPMHSRLGRAAIAGRPASRGQTAVRSRR